MKKVEVYSVELKDIINNIRTIWKTQKPIESTFIGSLNLEKEQVLSDEQLQIFYNKILNEIEFLESIHVEMMLIRLLKRKFSHS